MKRVKEDGSNNSRKEFKGRKKKGESIRMEERKKVWWGNICTLNMGKIGGK